ncbi:Uncharacterised protein [Candidatus Gugararchaeum adminiculabundum]|nr:Uncharacterised protein [Candidatus Gugararchaeum adminiculabundum]
MRRAFIFSLDGFTSLFVAILAIFTLYLLVNIPHSYFSSYEQAYDLASDGIAFLDSTKVSDPAANNLYHVYDPSSRLTLLETMVQDFASHDGQNPNDCKSSPKCGKIADDRVLGATIPKQFGYSLEYYDTQDSKWKLIYEREPQIANAQTKVSASAVRVVTTYAIPAQPGESPYCAITCHGFTGYDATGAPEYNNDALLCKTADPKSVPCAPPTATNSNPGEIIGPAAVRLTVYV